MKTVFDGFRRVNSPEGANPAIIFASMLLCAPPPLRMSIVPTHEDWAAGRTPGAVKSEHLVATTRDCVSKT